MTNLSYMAINKETNLPFIGAKGQVAFHKIGSLKSSMSQENKYEWHKGAYNYKLDIWEIYEVDSITKTMRKVDK